MSELSSPSVERSPSVSFDGLAIWFISDRESFRGRFWRATRPSLMVPWGTPVPISELSSPNFAFVAQGGLVVFFSFARAVAPGQQAPPGDLYWSARRSTDAAFPPPLPLDEVNSPFIDTDPNLSLDLLYLMFASNRTGNMEIYESHAVQ